MRFVISTAVLLLLLNSVQADSLDFDDLDLNFGDQIPQSYGDTEDIDVNYSLGTFGNPDQLFDFLNFGDNGFGDLQNFVFINIFDGNGLAATVTFFGLNGNQVTLESFDAAAQVDNPTTGTFHVYDGSFNLLYETSLAVTNIGHETIVPEVTASTIYLQWTAVSTPSTVGVDNIQFTVTNIPEPSAAVLLIFAGATFAYRRRRIGDG